MYFNKNCVKQSFPQQHFTCSSIWERAFIRTAHNKPLQEKHFFKAKFEEAGKFKLEKYITAKRSVYKAQAETQGSTALLSWRKYLFMKNRLRLEGQQPYCFIFPELWEKKIFFILKVLFCKLQLNKVYILKFLVETASQNNF